MRLPRQHVYDGVSHMRAHGQWCLEHTLARTQARSHARMHARTHAPMHTRMHVLATIVRGRRYAPGRWISSKGCDCVTVMHMSTQMCVHTRRHTCVRAHACWCGGSQLNGQHVYIHLYTHVYTHVCTLFYASLSTCLYTCLCTCLYAYLHTCWYTCLYTCLHRCGGSQSGQAHTQSCCATCVHMHIDML